MPFLFRSVYFYLMLLLMIFLSSAIVHTSPSRQPHEARRIPEEPWPDPVFKLNVSLDILSWDNLSIKLPPPVTSIDQNISELYINSLQTSLPYLLQQLNVDPARLDALVAEGIPLLQEAFFGLFSSDPGIWTDEVISDPDGPRSPDPISRLMRRGWFSKLKRWLKEIAIDAGCSIVAAAALPVYLIAADAFAVGNLFNGHNTQQDQDFYLRPVHGSVSHDDDIKVHYNAWFAPGFGSNVAGVTMGREIYLRGGNAEIWNNPDFMSVTKLLLHEFTHTLQYRDFLYFIPNFGFEYIFYTCKDGGYDNNRLEKAAYAKQEEMNALLNSFGTQFVQVFRNYNLQSTLGFPTAKSFDCLPERGTRNVFCKLNFENGVLHVQNGGPCHRTLTYPEQIANLVKPWIC